MAFARDELQVQRQSLDAGRREAAAGGVDDPPLQPQNYFDRLSTQELNVHSQQEYSNLRALFGPRRGAAVGVARGRRMAALGSSRRRAAGAAAAARAVGGGINRLDREAAEVRAALRAQPPRRPLPDDGAAPKSGRRSRRRSRRSTRC